MTPGNTAPVVSLTMPAIEPLATDCVHPDVGQATIASATRSPTDFSRPIPPPSQSMPGHPIPRFTWASVQPLRAAETSGYLQVRTVLECLSRRATGLLTCVKTSFGTR